MRYEIIGCQHRKAGHLKRSWHIRACVAQVDEADHSHPDEQPAQETHEVQQAVDVP